MYSPQKFVMESALSSYIKDAGYMMDTTLQSWGWGWGWGWWHCIVVSYSDTMSHHHLWNPLHLWRSWFWGWGWASPQRGPQQYRTLMTERISLRFPTFCWCYWRSCLRQLFGHGRPPLHHPNNDGGWRWRWRYAVWTLDMGMVSRPLFRWALLAFLLNMDLFSIRYTEVIVILWWFCSFMSNNMYLLNTAILGKSVEMGTMGDAQMRWL